MTERNGHIPKSYPSPPPSRPSGSSASRPSFPSRYSHLWMDDDAESFDGLVNLFDVAMVFAVALMVALVSFWQLPALLKRSDYTVITNPGKPDMEMIVKEGETITRYEASEETGVGRGELLGRAYRLADGRVVYVPKDREPILSGETVETEESSSP